MLKLWVQRIPRTQVDGQVHQVHRLVDGHNTRRPEHDVVGHLGETQLVVHGRADVVSCVDGAFLQSREDIRPREAHRGHTKLLENLSDHATGHTHLQAFHIRQAVHRLLGVNDVGVVLNRAHVKQTEFLVDLTGLFQHAHGIEHDVPLVRLIGTGRVGRQENGGRNLSGPVQGKGIHTLQNAVAHRLEKGVVIRGNRFGRVRLDDQLATGFLLHAVGPFLEQVIAYGASVPY